MSTSDDGGPVSAQGSMPRSTMAAEVRFTDEQQALLDGLLSGSAVPWDPASVCADWDALGVTVAPLDPAVLDAIQAGEVLPPQFYGGDESSPSLAAWSKAQYEAETRRREAEVRARLVSAVRDEIERCDDESIDFTATAEAVVEVFVKFLRTRPPIEGGSGGVTRRVFT